MEVLGLEFMEEIDGIKQMPMDGISFAYSFNDAEAKDQHTTQYYEMYGNRAIYKDGWKAVTIHGNRMPWDFAGTYPFEDDVWELYHVEEDFTESKNLASEYPEKLEELKAAWEEEAWKYNVFPLYDDLGARFTNVARRYAPQRKEFVFYPPGAVRISEPYSPPVKNKNHSISAFAEVPQAGAKGVLVAAGGLYGGYALFVDKGRLVYEYNAYNEDRFIIKSNIEIPKGKVELKAVYKANEDKTGTVTLFVNGEQAGQGPVNRTHPGQFSLSETFDVGEDTGTPVSKSYTRDNKFSGNLDRLVVQLTD
jgi:arylsulfatase